MGMRYDLRKQCIAPALVTTIVGLAGSVEAERKWTRSDILAIADKEAQGLGYDIERMGVSFDLYNSEWNAYWKTVNEGVQVLEPGENKFRPLSEQERQQTTDQLMEGLSDRNYWTVYYSPLAEDVRDGDLWVFIDCDTGEVVKVLRGG